ncbi:MAG: hypothetical protein ACI9KE_002004 [Polyangiales bacterium]|jgi:hypothetical protein
MALIAVLMAAQAPTSRGWMRVQETIQDLCPSTPAGTADHRHLWMRGPDARAAHRAAMGTIM